MASRGQGEQGAGHPGRGGAAAADPDGCQDEDARGCSANEQFDREQLSRHARAATRSKAPM
jgi:hypothetical protein